VQFIWQPERFLNIKLRNDGGVNLCSPHSLNMSNPFLPRVAPKLKSSSVSCFNVAGRFNISNLFVGHMFTVFIRVQQTSPFPFNTPSQFLSHPLTISIGFGRVGLRVFIRQHPFPSRKSFQFTQPFITHLKLFTLLIFKLCGTEHQQDVPHAYIRVVTS